MTEMWLLDEPKIKVHIVDKISLVAAILGMAVLAVASLSFQTLQIPQWIELAKNSKLVLYYDADSVEKHDGTLSVRILIDYDEQQKNPITDFQSVVDHVNLNCADKTYSSERRFLYPGKMASGSTPGEDNAPTPTGQAPDFLSPIMDAHCN